MSSQSNGSYIFIETPSSRLKNLLNPGTLSNIHKRSRNILPIFKEGVELNSKYAYEPNIQFYSQSILGHIIPSGVRLGGIFCPITKNHNIFDTPTIQADINPYNAATNLSIIYHPHATFRVECHAQLQPKVKTYDNFVALDYIGKSFTSNVTLYNGNKNFPPRIVASYLQNIKSTLSLGAEYVLDFKEPKFVMKNIAIAGRYFSNKSALACTLTTNGFDASFWQLINDTFQIGSSIDCTNETKVGKIFYQWMLEDSCIRGMIDSNWAVGVTYNRRVSNLCCNLGFSLMLCVPTNKVAYGLNFDFDLNKL